MTELKTKATDASIDDYIDSRASEEQKADCKALMTMLKRVAKHKMGRSCLYFKRLADIDMKVLEQLVLKSLGQIKRKYG